MCENKCSKSYLRLIISLNNTHAAIHISQTKQIKAHVTIFPNWKNNQLHTSP